MFFISEVWGETVQIQIPYISANLIHSNGFSVCVCRHDFNYLWLTWGVLSWNKYEKLKYLFLMNQKAVFYNSFTTDEHLFAFAEAIMLKALTAIQVENHNPLKIAKGFTAIKKGWKQWFEWTWIQDVWKWWRFLLIL